MRFWNKTSQEIFEFLETNQLGLSSGEAKKRLERYGLNTLPEKPPDTFINIFFRQFRNPLIYALILAAVIVIFIGEMADAAVIWAVLIFNAIVGTFQEGKAQNTLRALKKFVGTSATVLRDKQEIIISDSEVVPGDVLILREGQKISSDSRLLEENNLSISESMLTGESEPVHKTVDLIAKEDISFADQKNMVFRGTSVVSGDGKAIVVATGLDTAIGKISEKISSIETDMPLKTNLKYLSRIIILSAITISTILFITGSLSGRSIKEMFLVVVSLSVSIIPEGLPIVLTLVLANGVWRMSTRHALIKRLQAVEALGQASVIALDKTGTLTKNEMVVKEVFAGGKIFEVGGNGYDPIGAIAYGQMAVQPSAYPGLALMAKCAALCANVIPAYSEEDKLWHIAGDPTEAALAVFSKKGGFDKIEVDRSSPQISEIPFTYQTKYHATIHKDGRKKILVVTGAPEVIMSLSSSEWCNEKVRSLNPSRRLAFDSIFWKMSRKGLRVVATAISYDPPEKFVPEKIKELTLVGFFGIQDALRPDAVTAVREATNAGVKVIMITGDHVLTAEAIARQADIFHDGDLILTGSDMDELTDEDLEKKIGKITVFARVTPEHKLRIIEAYKNKGEIIAMTGDGVNDAPSLVAADLGVAMGKIGTEVAKEAADIVLLDDNFGSITAAIEEGRNIYRTIERVVLYLFSTSLGEIFTIAIALIIGFPLPILPAQIIWLNFVTDGFLDVSLAMEPKESGLLTGRFKRPPKYFVDKLMVQRMVVMAVPMVFGTLLLFKQYFISDLPHAWTVSLTALAVFQWFNAWNCRSDKKSIFSKNLLSNRFLVYATLLVTSLQIFAVYSPVMEKILGTVPLTLNDWVKILSTALLIIVAEEIRKFFYRKKQIKH